MKRKMRIFSVVMLAAAPILFTISSGCSRVSEPLSLIWVAVKSVGGDNGLFAEGQDYNFTLCFGYGSLSVEACQIAEITVKNSADEEVRTFVFDDFSNEKYYKPYKDASAATLELTYPAPANQPCTGALEIYIKSYEDEGAQQAGEILLMEYCSVIYLAESGVGTIIGDVSVNELWKRRCNILLAQGKLRQNEYKKELKKVHEGAWTSLYRRGASSEWVESGLNDGGDVNFIETVTDSGIALGTFSTTTDHDTVTVSYLTQLDSGWCSISPGRLYKKNKQLFYLTAETENGVETWFVLYNDGRLTPSRPVNGWCSGVNGDTIDITDSQNSGAVTRYMFSDDMVLFELQN